MSTPGWTGRAPTDAPARPSPVQTRTALVQACTALLVMGGALSAAPATAGAQGTQTISRAELDAAGVTRLSELFFVVRGAARASVDGITVGGDVSGVPAWQLAPGAAAWQVLVDGQPVPVEAAGTALLDLLPVSLAQLDSVTVQRRPALVGGRLAMHGVLHLHSQRNTAGVRASASHYSGNEVGDPGPFAFTGEATPNVDNNGPFHQLRLSYGRPRADVDLALRRWADNLTDIRLRQRYVDAAAPAAPHLWVNHLAPTARGSFTALGARHTVHAGRARTTGTFFVPAAREDQSLATVFTFAGLSGATRSSAGGADSVPHGGGATYRVAVSSLAMTRDGAMPATLSHTRQQLDAGATLSHSFGAVPVTAGLALVYRSLEDAPAIPAFEGEVEGDIHLSAALGGHSGPSVAASLGAGVAGIRGGAVVELAHALDARTRLRLSAAGRTRALGDDGTWIDLALLGLDSIAGTRRTSYSASAEWARRLAAGADLSLSAAARRELGLHVVSPAAVTRLPSLAPRTGPALSLNTAELGAALELPFGGAMLGGASYRFTMQVRGSDAMHDATAMVPRHLLDASVTIVPAFDIRVRPAVHLASGTRWLAGTSTDAMRVPAINRLDLSIEKWMLQRRLRLQLIGRNLLNDVERYHPLGADFRLRVFAGATATF